MESSEVEYSTQTVWQSRITQVNGQASVNGRVTRLRSAPPASNDIDSVGRNPNIDLLESPLQNLLDLSHALPVLRCVVEVEANSNQLVVKDCALVKPAAVNDDGV